MICVKVGDITQEEVDAIVNAANSKLAGGGGVDGAIHRAAGPSVMEACRKIGGCPTGSARITEAGRLHAKKIIHAVGPVWNGGGRGEPGLLESCYVESFQLAKQAGCRTLALPAISTGVYRYPKEAAAKIAIAVGKRFEKDFDAIHFVCFSVSDEDIYKRALRDAGNEIR